MSQWSKQYHAWLFYRKKIENNMANIIKNRILREKLKIIWKNPK